MYSACLSNVSTLSVVDSHIISQCYNSHIVGTVTPHLSKPTWDLDVCITLDFPDLQVKHHLIIMYICFYTEMQANNLQST